VSTLTTASERSLAGRIVGGPVGFRRLLERLGPTYIKLGQFLALRPDLIPEEYTDELMHLLDQLTPFSWAEAEAILTAELGAPPSEVFAYLNPRPTAAGSLAQVHSARLHDGTEVAVKIQRPGIEERVMRDLGRARKLARVLEIGRVSAIVPPGEIVEELTRWMIQELDFRHELENLVRLYELTTDSAIARIPRPYPSLSTARVLTADYLHGIPFSELLIALRTGATDELGRVHATGLDRDRLAANLIRTTLTQMFRYGFFHADLHPGNLMALPDDVIGFVDFGLCDELDETVRERQMRYLAAVYGRDVDQMFAALLDVLIPGEETDIAAFRRDFSAETRTYFGRLAGRGEGEEAADRSPIALWMIGVMRTARKHGMRLPPRVLSMYRALLTAESVAHQLGSRANLRVVGRDFFSSLRMEQAIRALDPNTLQASALTLLSLVRDSPGQVHQILSEIASGRFALTVNVTEAPRTVRARNRRARLVATSILTVSVSALFVAAAVSSADPAVWWLLGVLLAALYAVLLFEWRRL
jgi:ubiquinone biosynthesis protein